MSKSIQPEHPIEPTCCGRQSAVDRYRFALIRAPRWNLTIACLGGELFIAHRDRGLASQNARASSHILGSTFPFDRHGRLPNRVRA